MLPALAAMTLVLAAQTPPQPPPADAAATEQGKKTMTQQTKPKQSPDLDLIGYLGDYGDAADGLDPMGLAENAAVLKPAKSTPQSPPESHP
ncbi:MAG: hypothetical protein KGP08_03265 [Xanthomonadaceae bacterium]|nr:hypothetical protein [Xanthomonadaceae bacterium]MDE1884415.1 hypothetical protein [Xanthomonadaceae bacterium]MDE2256805.1 hypothetical protein [Xanthomonadaceae bacterium]